MTTQHLIDDIKRDEGLSLTAYPDPRSQLAVHLRKLGMKATDYRHLDDWQIFDGKPWTVGYGCTGEGIGPNTVWTQQQADDEIARRVSAVVSRCMQQFPWWHTLNDARQDVVANLAYNLGVAKLLLFRNTLAAIEAGNYDQAARGMMASAWADQVGHRADRLSLQMKTGIRS